MERQMGPVARPAVRRVPDPWGEAWEEFWRLKKSGVSEQAACGVFTVFLKDPRLVHSALCVLEAYGYPKEKIGQYLTGNQETPKNNRLSTWLKKFDKP